MAQWPLAAITIDDIGNVEVQVAGITRQTRALTIEEARQAGLAILTAYAAWFGRDLTATCSDPTGAWTINVSQSGKATDATIKRQGLLGRKK
ncbi:MAG: hypothetical protein ACTHWJ_04650 [Flaviflexus sp.]|uniref:hypothetical protein n=1 Tax=Flaviflexus sp. TaxID=1969482 RepID=UPI003F92909F